MKKISEKLINNENFKKLKNPSPRNANDVPPKV